MTRNTFIRPLYTCGAFNRQAQRAVMYNTANGTCYTFDGVSALLVNEVLAGKREEPIDIRHIAEVTGTTDEQVLEFFRESLMPIGLVHDHVFSDDEWHQYRQDHPPVDSEKWYKPEGDYQESLPAEVPCKLYFELTYACSERCLHCYNEGAARSDLHEEHRLRPDMLTLDDYKRIVDEAVELGIPEVTVTGGDPFSYPDCWAILDYLHERNLAVNLFTNAQALNSSEKIRRVARMGLRQFSVSIYSADADVHDQITRRRGSWKQSVKVLRELATWPVPLNIKTPVFRMNTRSYYRVRDLVGELSAEKDFSCLLTPGVDGDVSMIEHLQTRPEALRLLMMDPLMKGNVPADGKFKEVEHGQGQGFPCGADKMLTVSPDGLVRGCLIIGITFGNMHNASLKDVIFSPKRMRLRQTDRGQLLPPCGKYDYCRYCHQPCMAGEKFEELPDGSFTTVEANNSSSCQMAKVRMELCEQIKQGIDPLGGKSLEECLAAQPVEKVPLFSKKVIK